MVPLFGLIGVVLIVLAAGVALISLTDRTTRKRLRNTPAHPVARTPGGAVVKILGRVAPSEQGTVVGPFSGRHGVHLKTMVSALGQQSFSVYSELQQREFWIDDGSGEYARVQPAGARVEIDCVPVQSTNPTSAPSPEVESFMTQHGLSTKTAGITRSLDYKESLLAVGDPVLALGPAARQPRPGAGAVLVLCAQPGDAGELILTNLSEQSLLSRLRSNLLAAKVLALLGVLFLIATLIHWLVST